MNGGKSGKKKEGLKVFGDGKRRTSKEPKSKKTAKTQIGRRVSVDGWNDPMAQSSDSCPLCGKATQVGGRCRYLCYRRATLDKPWLGPCFFVCA